jgi:hypothetical protein
MFLYANCCQIVWRYRVSHKWHQILLSLGTVPRTIWEAGEGGTIGGVKCHTKTHTKRPCLCMLSSSSGGRAAISPRTGRAGAQSALPSCGWCESVRQPFTREWGGSAKSRKNNHLAQTWAQALCLCPGLPNIFMKLLWAPVCLTYVSCQRHRSLQNEGHCHLRAKQWF